MLSVLLDLRDKHKFRIAENSVSSLNPTEHDGYFEVMVSKSVLRELVEDGIVYFINR